MSNIIDHEPVEAHTDIKRLSKIMTFALQILSYTTMPFNGFDRFGFLFD